MINNEFRMIGTAITDFVETKVGNAFTMYYLTIESEKLGSQVGNKFIIPIRFFNTNRAINFKSKVKGHLVAVNGYIDAKYNTMTKINETNLVGQNVYILDNGKIGIDDNIQGILNSYE